MTRWPHLAVVAVVVLGSLTAFAGPAVAADDAFVSVDVEATPDPAPPGTNVTVTATVENAHDDGAAFRLQRVTLRETETADGDWVDREDPTAVVGAGETNRVALFEEFDRTGEYDRYVHVRLRSSDGRVVTLVRPVDVTVEQTHPSMALSATDRSPSGKADLSLTVANGLPETVRGVTVDVESDSLTFSESRRVVSNVSAGETATLTFPAREASVGRQTVETTLRYLTADGESRSVTRTLSTTLEDEGEPGNVTLTGLRVTGNDSELVVRGSASNVGATNASAVLVSVADGDRVGPAQNQAEYFVGEVERSDYASFEVHGQLEVDTNETVTVPLKVSYDVDGDRVSKRVNVEYTPRTTGDEAANQQSSAPVVPAVAGVVVLVGGALGYRRFR